MGRFYRNLLLLVLAAGASTGSTLKIIWNTDPGNNGSPDNAPIGPDGPWQAPLWLTSNNDDAPLFPSLFYGITVADKSAGGEYNPRGTSAKIVDGQDLESSDLYAADYYKVDSEVTTYFDTWKVEADPNISINVTVFDATKWDISLPNNKQYSPKIGFMGLGDNDGTSPGDAPPGVLKQLQSNNSIGSRSFSMNMGSAKLGQSGSLVLGGYDQSRALGDVGKWDFERSLGLFLKDVNLGVEQGGSPFTGINITQGSPASLWQGVGGNERGKNTTRQAGGPDGSALVVPATAFSSIYLPKGNCEAVAKHLPVTWRKDIGYYVWNTTDEQYKKIISSPAYLGFVLATSEAKNLTIKVPFGLLDLTLESPIVDAPTAYFPCQSYDGIAGVWSLGRAFLQAAFMHVDFEKQAIYMAQGPGPTLEQSVIQSYTPGSSIKTNPISSFAKTWQSHWTVLPGGDGVSEHKQEKGLAASVIAGIVVGVVVALAAVGVLVWFLRRRQGKAKANEGETAASSGEEKPVENNAGELQGSGGFHEAPGAYLSHEVQGETPNVRYEMPDHSQPLELYGDGPASQIPRRKPVQ